MLKHRLPSEADLIRINGIIEADGHHHLEETLGGSSELAQIRNLHWWTVDTGSSENWIPRIYGAASSPQFAESYYCMQQK